MNDLEVLKIYFISCELCYNSVEKLGHALGSLIIDIMSLQYVLKYWNEVQFYSFYVVK